MLDRQGRGEPATRGRLRVMRRDYQGSDRRRAIVPILFSRFPSQVFMEEGFTNRCWFRVCLHSIVVGVNVQEAYDLVHQERLSDLEYLGVELCYLYS